MHIKNLSLKNFRNYEDLNISFDKDVNIFYGNNAQGKTNILEAIYLCSTTKSQRGSKDKEIISFGCDESHIKMEVIKGDRNIRIDFHLRKGKSKFVSVNKSQIKKSKDIIGNIGIVFFSPEDLNIIKDGPKKRRKFIDMELCQIDKVYIDCLSKYNKILKERNIILKEKKYDSKRDELLDIYDLNLIKYGEFIIKRREIFIKEINELIVNIHKKLTGNKEIIEIKYEPNVKKEEFREKIKNNRKKDIYNKTTNIGPHRDDMGFYIDNIDARIYGSQGQQRTCALSLKLAEIEIIKKEKKENPILLLDDVLSELDKYRQEYLLESIKNVQTFITCTGVEEFISRHLGDGKVFHVVRGKIS